MWSWNCPSYNIRVSFRIFLTLCVLFVYSVYVCMWVSLSRNKITMPVLQELLPHDMLLYCQEHNLLGTVLGNASDGPSKTEQGGASYAQDASTEKAPIHTQ